MLAGEPYRADDAELVSDRRHCQEILRNFNNRPEQELATSGLGRIFGSVGEKTFIETPFICDYGYNISIGTDSFINYGGVVLDVARVSIGDQVRIATGVHIVTAEHPLEAAASTPASVGGAAASRPASRASAGPVSNWHAR